MELDVKVNGDSLSIAIPDPYEYDLGGICDRIESFAASKEADLCGLDVRGLIPRLIKGIAGCEGGCPADAKGLVSEGFSGFKLQYIEGGILSANAALTDGPDVSIKMFPDF